MSGYIEAVFKITDRFGVHIPMIAPVAFRETSARILSRMGKRRGNARGFEFDKPLARPDSTAVHRCYASHGKGYGGSPPFNRALRILCLNASREIKWVDGFYNALDRFTCDAMRGDKKWVRLGWVLADGTLPLGELDRVDPTLAQFDYLRAIDDRDVPIPHSVVYPPGHQHPDWYSSLK